MTMEKKNEIRKAKRRAYARAYYQRKRLEASRKTVVHTGSFPANTRLSVLEDIIAAEVLSANTKARIINEIYQR